jgi:UDP-glucose 4-epimerase
MEVLVTGGSGQGWTICDVLSRGDKVVSIENLATGRRDDLTSYERLRVLEGSSADEALVHRAVSDFKPSVIHTAASYEDPSDWAEDALVNAVGTLIIAEARTYKVDRLIHFQTALRYGTQPMQQPIKLDHPINPVNSSYAIPTAYGEGYVQFSGTDWITFRLANVIGPQNVSGPRALAGTPRHR